MSHDAGGTFHLLGARDGPGEKSPVATMHPVEIADRNDRAARVDRNMRVAVYNLHLK